MSQLNRGRFHVQISPDAWQAHAVARPGLTFIGTLTRGQSVAGLAVDACGNYFAVNGRFASPVPARKVQAALGLAASVAGVTA